MAVRSAEPWAGNGNASAKSTHPTCQFGRLPTHRRRGVAGQLLEL